MKMIITRKQLSELTNFLKEENTVNISTMAKDNNLNSFSTAASDTHTQSDIQKAKTAGDVNLVINGPKTSDDMPRQEINVGAGDTVQNAIAKQGNNELLQQGGSMQITGDGFGESKVYMKKMVEEVRLKNLRKNSKVMSKKQMNEEILDEIIDMF